MAGLAGLALSHVVARAILTSCVNRGIGFIRTPKNTATQGLLRALHAAREELLFLTACVIGSVAGLWREDSTLLDGRLIVRLQDTLARPSA